MARLNKKLNLIVPVKQDDGSTFYVHSMPVSREVFEQHFMVMAKAFGTLFSEGMSWLTGPRVAMLVIKREADAMGIKEAVERDLIQEMYRLSNVVMPSDQGWTTVPYFDVIRDKLIDDEARAEVDNALAFFTLVSAVQGQKGVGVANLEGGNRLWETKITPSSLMEFSTSLPTLTEIAPSTSTEVSSVPS